MLTESVYRLSIAAKRMAKQNVLVKDLQGVETLGTIPSFPKRRSF
jgi:magnesium-transporting ATPase (P-type)